VQLDALQPADAKREESVVILESSKLALHRYAVSVEGAEAFPVTGDARVVTVEKVTELEAHPFVLHSDRNDRADAALLALLMDAIPTRRGRKGHTFPFACLVGTRNGNGARWLRPVTVPGRKVLAHDPGRRRSQLERGPGRLGSSV
jgi:hypothetical protein